MKAKIKTKKKPVKKKSIRKGLNAILSKAKKEVAKKAEPKPKLIDTGNWSDRQKTESFELRCTKNFKKVLEALSKIPLKQNSYYSSNKKSDVVIFAIRELAKKHKLADEQNEYYI